MKKIATILMALCAAIASGATTVREIGEVLPALTLKDQHDKPHTLDDSVRRIYANADRKGDALMKETMAQLEPSALDAQKAVVIAEISAAPFFIKSIIRGSLKDRRYTTWLDTQGETQKLLPYRPEKVTVIELEQRRITAIRYIGDTQSLRQELAPAKTEEKK